MAIDNSFITWLQDTSNQFRSASLTLAGYNLGGLYGQDRDAAITVANASVALISDKISNTNQWIAYYQSILDILNSDPNGFVDAATYNKLQTPDSVQAGIDTFKASINSGLSGVQTALQYH